jgi:hypothetical protein
MPTVGADTSDGMHFCSRPVVPCSQVITGRRRAGCSVGANTAATAVAGVLSLTLVVYKMRQPLMPDGSVTSLSGSLRSNAPGRLGTSAGGS